jgi:chaperonin cofactor prefoldin
MSDDYSPGAIEDAAVELFDQLEWRIEKLEEQVDRVSLEDLLDRIEARLDRIEGRINRIERYYEDRST